MEDKQESLMNKPSVLLMCLADPSGDPRPYRMIQLCNQLGMEVHIASIPPQKALPVVNVYSINQLSNKTAHKLIRRFLGVTTLFLPKKLRDAATDIRYGLRKFREAIKGKSFHLIIVEDLYLLPIAYEIDPSAKIIFDAREYYPEQSSENLLWKFTERFNRIRLCQEFLPKCNAILTVSPGLVEEYKKNFGVNCHLFRSVPPFSELSPSVPNGSIRMVHHGGAMRARKIENMIDLFKFLDNRFHLDFYLVGDATYIKELEKLAEPHPNIRFCAPVEYLEIGKMLSSYDIGLYLFEPTSFNALRALPNKFFEFIQARLVLAIGPSPDMMQLINEFQCGIVSNSFITKDLAEKLNSLTEQQIITLKNNSNTAAKTLCWEAERCKLIGIINSMLSLRP